IILTTINARYVHSAFGLRCLWANLGALRERTVLREFQSRQSPDAIADTLLEAHPRIIGFGVYIWNAAALTAVVHTIRERCSDTTIVLGGPEVAYEYESTELFALGDYLVRGEGEQAFTELAEGLLAGRPPARKIIHAAPPALDAIELPYDAYTHEDIAHRMLYVETSRGCPFQCDFCLSALEPGVREFPLPPFFDAVERLLGRGARRFRFVDRTFNLRDERVEPILRFFLDRWIDGMQLHLEIMPDRLTPCMLDLMARFPPTGLHLEVGVQTFVPSVLETIHRTQDPEQTERNLRFLRCKTGALLHSDLVAGLPGQTWEHVAADFDRLLALRPHEIQVGILKRLKGAPIERHVEPYAMRFALGPPYEILQTDTLSSDQLQRITRFARYLDRYYNSNNFPQSLPLLWQTHPSPFDAFMAFSDRLWQVFYRTHHLPLNHLAEQLYLYLAAQRIARPSDLACLIRADYHRLPGRHDTLNLPYA
ncbi:MAG TPA: DUF4080 domain-containing protein, partial [Candidatus Hydrogenedentes bacterium]|nr:DUF4080 domain-containing protein [Candidatus Hydrogenedentota bacterium]